MKNKVELIVNKIKEQTTFGEEREDSDKHCNYNGRMVKVEKVFEDPFVICMCGEEYIGHRCKYGIGTFNSYIQKLNQVVELVLKEQKNNKQISFVKDTIQSIKMILNVKLTVEILYQILKILKNIKEVSIQIIGYKQICKLFDTILQRT